MTRLKGKGGLRAAFFVIARSERVRPLASPMINSATKQSSNRYAVSWIASLRSQ
jgi:hypothetical protein